MSKIGIVAGTFHEEIVEDMIEKAVEKAENEGFDTEVHRVSGAFDTPLITKKLAQKENIEAVTVIGAIVEGDTDHDSVIGHAVARKLQQISLEYEKPVTLGITGPGMTAEEAYERRDYGMKAVEAAINSLETMEEI